MHKPVFSDLHKLPEDERIKVIAHYAVEHQKKVSFVTDDEPGKPERYIKKLEALHPGVFNFQQMKGPTKGAVSIILTFKPKPSTN